jgi:hypothetical protein
MVNVTPDFQDDLVLGLLYLWADEQCGYDRMGVRGWILREELEAATNHRFPERLPRLAGAGLLDRDDVRAPGFGKPVWVYRISQRGARYVGERAGTGASVQPLGPRTEADRAVYVPPPALTALRHLCVAFERGHQSPLLPGEVGWMTTREVLEDIWGNRFVDPGLGWRGDRWSGDEDEDVPDDTFFSGSERGWDELHGGMPRGQEEAAGSRVRNPYSDDFQWLVRAGFAQRFGVERTGRKTVVLFRATPTGRTAQPLVAAEP